MKLATYADFAVRLVNTEAPDRGTDRLADLGDVRGLFAGNLAGRRAVPADVPRLRAVRPRFRAVFAAAAAGRDEEAAAVLNRLLLDHPVSPQLSGHERSPASHPDDPDRPERSDPGWHLHLAEHARTAAALYAAVAAMGLAVLVTEQGMRRLGVCAAPPCCNAFLDTSSNCSRRYCSERCATRANVAAYRARRRAASALPGAASPGARGSRDGRGQ